MLHDHHRSNTKGSQFTFVDVFHFKTGSWLKRNTSGAPPIGVEEYACAALGDDVYFFGGYCSHDNSYHNNINKLNTLSMQWSMLKHTTSENSAPMKKTRCGMIGFNVDEEGFLFIIGGSSCFQPSYHQPGAKYDKTKHGYSYTNEQHLFILSTSECMYA